MNERNTFHSRFLSILHFYNKKEVDSVFLRFYLFFYFNLDKSILNSVSTSSISCSFIPTTIAGVVQLDTTLNIRNLRFIPTTIAGVVQPVATWTTLGLTFYTHYNCRCCTTVFATRSRCSLFYTHYNCGCCTTSKSRFTEW